MTPVPLKVWLDRGMRRGILPGLFASLLLVFVLSSYLTVRAQIDSLLAMNSEFAASQVKSLQVYDYSPVQEQLSRFSRGKPFQDAQINDANGTVIARWNPDETSRDTRGFRSALTLWSAPSQRVEISAAGGIRIHSVLGGEQPVGEFSVTLALFPLLKGALVVTAFFLLVLVFLYRYVTHFVTRVARIAAEPIEKLSAVLERAESFDLSAGGEETPPVTEVRDLIHASREMAARLKSAEENRVEAEKMSAVGRMASQLAHDIRSPLSALAVVAEDLSGVSENKRILLRSAITRIQDIANGLLDKRDEGLTSRLTVEEVASLVESVVSEKRLQLRARPEVNLLGIRDVSAYGVFAEVDAVELKRAVSNLINNAIEALAAGGTVSVELRGEAEGSVLEISDNGGGIAPELLSRLGQEGVTTKAGGSGLGLSHARRLAESWGGSLSIQSELGLGTRVSVKLPRAEAPAWFVPEIILRPGMRVVVLDDDLSVHALWRERFAKLDLERRDIRCDSFACATEAAEAVRGYEGELLCLVDYELLGQPGTGLDFIETLGLSAYSILVTSRSESAEVLAELENLRVGMLPKNLAPLVPIGVAEGARRVVLIDDDILVHLTWQRAAERRGVELRTFHTVESFLEAGWLGEEVEVYIDEGLGNGVRGHREAKRLFESGFRDIYLTTGLPEAFQDGSYPWLRAVLNKEPPFA